MPNQQMVLRFSHNVVEHLGLKLYQNRPTRVIAEIVSNSWDADAQIVNVNTAMADDSRWVAVHDDGIGMSHQQLVDEFLIIGRRRRTAPGETSDGGRPLTGRKGIGKLAPFGIASTVEVLTASARDSSCTWLRFDLRDLLATDSEGLSEYHPQVVHTGSLESAPVEADETGQAPLWKKLIDSSNSASGTMVLMRDLSIMRAISDSRLVGSLGRRFTITMRDDFKVEVNGSLVERNTALPTFEFRIPEDGFNIVSVNGKEVRFWAGFVENADWPQDRAGVGVYAHGKLAQDRPFTFGIKGKEIFSRYLYGVVEADWLDELPVDLISTDRTSIDWDSEETAALHEWGRRAVGAWIASFHDWRKSRDTDENRIRVVNASSDGTSPRVTPAEQDQIVELVSKITPSIGKDEDAKDRLVQVVSKAWVQEPMRELVSDLWEQIGDQEEVPPSVFSDLVQRLSDFSVPESLSLAVVFAQRAYALAKLHEHVHNGIETDLQLLIERFPWIIEPDLAVLTANQALKTAVNRAAETGQIPTGRRVAVAGVPDRNRPDFVFLSSPEERQIVIVELKNPQEDLTIDNRAQLTDYMQYFEAHYSDADIHGVLVGRNPGNLPPKFEGLRIVQWTDVLKASRARHLELLAAMLVQSGGNAKGDSRVNAAIELAGDDATSLFQNLASKYSTFREFFDEVDDSDNEAT